MFINFSSVCRTEPLSLQDYLISSQLFLRLLCDLHLLVLSSILDGTTDDLSGSKQTTDLFKLFDGLASCLVSRDMGTE